MAREDSTIPEFDLSSVYAFGSSTEWVRNSILLSPGDAKILQIRVKLPPGANPARARYVTVLMDSGDAYLVGFRGKDDVIYLLQDKSKDVESRLRQAKLIAADEKPVILNLGADHRSLRTFYSSPGTSREFDAIDLQRVALLSEYSSKNERFTYADIRSAMSLLVCMIAESARARMIELSFQKLYYNQRVSPDKAIQSYDAAKQITTLANRFFNNPILWDRVEKLEKRGREIKELLGLAREASGQEKFDRKDFLSKALTGLTSGQSKTLANATGRLREMSRELHNIDAGEMLRIVQLCSNEDAVRAAKRGVVVPPVV